MGATSSEQKGSDMWFELENFDLTISSHSDTPEFTVLCKWSMPCSRLDFKRLVHPKTLELNEDKHLNDKYDFNSYLKQILVMQQKDSSEN